jgi:predicted neutral ceramidase superfamily lipid hydrolase
MITVSLLFLVCCLITFVVCLWVVYVAVSETGDALGSGIIAFFGAFATAVTWLVYFIVN